MWRINCVRMKYALLVLVCPAKQDEDRALALLKMKVRETVMREDRGIGRWGRRVG